MKFIHLALASILVVLVGCSTHFYTLEEKNVTIFLKYPKAQKIVFACSLDEFEPQVLNRHNGLWEVTLPSDNSFKYFYIVDGEIFIPPCPLQENNDFGSKNCIFEPKL